MARRKTMKKGGGTCGALYGGAYGVGSPIAAGALEYGAAYTGPVNAQGGAVPDPTDPQGGFTGIGGRRRRKTRKGTKKTRKTRRRKTRKMRGGASQVSAGSTYASFKGDGAGGLADFVPGHQAGNAF
jgi:hypothetical protein